MRRWLILALTGIALAGASAAAGQPSAITRDGVRLSFAQEQRAEVIGNKLRCLVCQNETVENSQAGLARQFRGIIRRRVVAGETNRQVMDFMVKRYGIYVLLKPPLIPETWLLWFSPLVAALIGLAIVLFARRRRKVVPPPLSPEESARLKEILS